MCPSSWKLNLDDFFGSPLAHVEAELHLFEVDEDGDELEKNKIRKIVLIQDDGNISSAPAVHV